MNCDYDNSLPRFAKLSAEHLGRDVLLRQLVLRDAVGRLTLIWLEPEACSPDKLAALTTAVMAEVQPYVEAGMVVATPEQLFDEDLRDSKLGNWERIVVGEDYELLLRVLDRRLVGQDWQTRPKGQIPDAPPIIVFASLKGGVGRSTALAVAAADFAAHGRNVLVIDLDLEAPGLGSMLLSAERTPKYGAVDYFVENGLSPLEDDFLQNLVGTSELTRSRGLVHVVPAVGQQSQDHPHNFLGKIGRAYLEDPGPDGTSQSFLVQTRELVDRLAKLNPYDVILVDTRAGLHETTAAAILGLGATVLCFGVDTPQTFLGYRFLFAHLNRFASEADRSDDWRMRIRMVHAKAAPGRERMVLFGDQVYDLFQAYLYDEDQGDATQDNDAFVFSLGDSEDEAPHRCWRILNDSQYFEFDPLARPDMLDPQIYGQTFGPFVEELRAFIWPEEVPRGD